MPDDIALCSRLRNCLTTILELEDPLLQTHMGDLLVQEFKSLKEVLKNLEFIDAREADVERIEAATDRFLMELKDITADAAGTAARKRVLQ